MITIKRGLDLPIRGVPEPTIDRAPGATTVALLGDDYVALRPKVEVREGEQVRLGQVLLRDKRVEGVCHTSPGCGRVVGIHRGAKRVLQSIVVELDGDEEETFAAYAESDLARLARQQVVENLVRSGLWTALRTRPYSRVPSPGSVPRSLFVTAMDTNPLAAPPEMIIEETDETWRRFVCGLEVLRRLSDGPTYVCRAPGTLARLDEVKGLEIREFAGPHPAGLPGTHIHFLDPVHVGKSVWHVGYQDVMAIGGLFLTGRLPVERVVALGGPAVRRPRLLRTRLGANLTELVHDELDEGPVRVVSGSVLTGHQALPPCDYLGRYHLQVSALPDRDERRFLGWSNPFRDKFSVKRVFWTALLGRRHRFAFTTSREGSLRPMVPIGSYERVMPLDILPTQLLRALLTDNTERAIELGCLELDEEDLALCSFVCPGKIEYGPILRRNLAAIEKEE
jgi:Na+-transporting NADH:ubiquinone oxidoreductase subunit A